MKTIRARFCRWHRWAPVGFLIAVIAAPGCGSGGNELKLPEGTTAPEPPKLNVAKPKPGTTTRREREKAGQQ